MNDAFSKIHEALTEYRKSHNADLTKFRMNEDTAKRLVASIETVADDHWGASNLFGIPVAFDETVPNGWIVPAPEGSIIVIAAEDRN